MKRIIGIIMVVMASFFVLWVFASAIGWVHTLLMVLFLGGIPAYVLLMLYCLFSDD